MVCSRNRGARTALLVAQLLLAVSVAAALVGPAPAGAQVAPQITVSPSSGLVDGQTVTITGSGFQPGQLVYPLQCAPDAVDVDGCDLRLSGVLADSQGAFVTTTFVTRQIVVNSGGMNAAIDCVVVTCKIAAGYYDSYGEAPISFAPAAPLPPELHVSLSNSYEPDVRAMFTGQLLPPSSTVTLENCFGDSGAPTCTSLGDHTTTSAGSLSVGPLDMPRLLVVGTEQHDCVLPGCFARLRAGSDVLATSTYMMAPLPGDELDLTVTPTTDLVDGQVVSIEGARYFPNSLVGVKLCPGTNVDDCDSYAAEVITESDYQGYLEFLYDVRRFLVDDEGQLVDCAQVVCVMWVGNHQVSGTAALHFAPAPPLPPPDLEVSEVTDTDDGRFTASVTAEGLAPGNWHTLRLCANTSTETCEGIASTSVATTGSGTIGPTTIRLNRLRATSEGWFDCAEPPGCRLEAVSVDRVVATTPVPMTTTEVTLTIDPLAVAGPGPVDAIATATITCNRDVPVEVAGTVTQGGLSGGHSFTSSGAVGTWCRRSAPLTAYLPAYDPAGSGQFTPGPATVSVTARPDTQAGATVTATATVDLVDHSVLLDALVAAMAGPEAEATFTAFVRGVELRYWQDPTFAHQWRLAMGSALFD